MEKTRTIRTWGSFLLLLLLRRLIAAGGHTDDGDVISAAHQRQRHDKRQQPRGQSLSHGSTSCFDCHHPTTESRKNPPRVCSLLCIP